MGIRGLETFISDYYKKNPRSVQLKKLKDLKLVIDGNQLPYMIQIRDRESSEGLYGGNYDQIHQRLLDILSRLKPFIECIVFDGSKELPSKATERLKKKIFEVANVREADSWRQNSAGKSSDEIHKDNLLRLPPLFMKTIIINLCNELGIKHYMADGFADHSIAVHANQGPETFTIFSGDSCFYVYDLKSGYIANKNGVVEDLFRYPERIDGNAEVPVFYLESFMRTMRLQNHITWIYFCLLLGDNDIGLMRNIDYFRSAHIDTRSSFMPLVDYLSRNEPSLLRSNFDAIRKSYQGRNLLSIFDEQLNIYQLINRDCKIVTPISGLISDFDRYVETVKKIGANFSWCCVEDCREESVVRVCKSNSMLRFVYRRILDMNSGQKQLQIDEYLRTKSPSSYSFLTTEKIVTRSNEGVKELDYMISYLEKKDKQADILDDFTLLLTALSVWLNWLEQNKYENDIKTLHPSKNFIDAVIFNYLIISIKNCFSDDVATSNSTHKQYQNRIKQLVNSSSQQMKSLINVYDQIIGKVDMVDYQAYVSEDLRIVHRLNEFKSVYYLLGVINKLNGYQNLGFLSPKLFLNCFFQFCMIQSASSKIPSNGRSGVAKAKELRGLMTEINGLRELIDELRSLVHSTRQELANTNKSASSQAVDVADALEKLNI